MADRPSTSAARVGSPKTRSAHQTPHVVGSKVGRPRSKSALTSKITDSSKMTKVKKTPAKPTKQVKVVPPPESRVIEIDSDNSDIEFPFHSEGLPDLPPVEQEQSNLPTGQQNQVANLPPVQEQPNQVEQPNQEPNQVPNQPVDAPAEEPNQPHQHNLPPDQPPNLPDLVANQQQLNWSYFKPEFAGKPEDVEAHLLRTNDWMDTQSFPDDQKVRRFCLTLTCEVRLWYETIRQVQMDWPKMKEHFR